MFASCIEVVDNWLCRSNLLVYKKDRDSKCDAFHLSESQKVVFLQPVVGAEVCCQEAYSWDGHRCIIRSWEHWQSQFTQVILLKSEIIEWHWWHHDENEKKQSSTNVMNSSQLIHNDYRGCWIETMVKHHTHWGSRSSSSGLFAIHVIKSCVNEIGDATHNRGPSVNRSFHLVSVDCNDD